MDLLAVLVVISALLVATLSAGAVILLRGRLQGSLSFANVVDPSRLGAGPLGTSATLLQFSTLSCGRCPGMHRTLSALANDSSGVNHLDIDVTERPDIAQHFHVVQTPTTLILDSNGMIRTRFGGVPSRDVVALELSQLTEK
ncbi:thiol-disulfide isomerase/thioredoxin [Microbacterium halimionae]|uniref:Thiol-disulfide isomerase/thioredoxin n=1 Tax=Microbacterium halimionae TaxID=1526413 RepID=A0A7W3JP70_9MICO|nr:thioredoxin family protein [Microbacterium halimionae]MBA8816457.1 thiol-disulfide isomerase/thioredoxin [Microbacterium halimionae]NII95356.1 thiol-disulfide isomerase/thioredoxin [Microbacterium halimionae]